MRTYTESLHGLRKDLSRKISQYQFPEDERLILSSLGTDPWRRNRFQVINQVEQGVTMLQTARKGADKVHNWLKEMKEFLEDLQERTAHTLLPESVVQHYLEDRLDRIREVVRDVTFQNRQLLTGEFGVKTNVTGNRLQFVRGGPFVKSSGPRGYSVAIFGMASRSAIIGQERLTEESLRVEKMISLFEGTQVMHYKLKKGEDPDSFVKNLQDHIIANGLDLSVFRTTDDHLIIMHNQKGSFTKFAGISHKTRLISANPGVAFKSIPGEDIQGTISGETAIGYGNFLIGSQGNQQTEGLIVYYDGKLDFPGQVVGNIYVEQKGLAVQTRLDNSDREIITVPSLLPETQAIGVTNNSGLGNLSMVRGKTELQRLDSLRLINWALEDLNGLAEEWREKENYFVSKAVDLLKSSMKPEHPSDEKFQISTEKAKKMADDLKTMLISGVS